MGIVRKTSRTKDFRITKVFNLDSARFSLYLVGLFALAARNFSLYSSVPDEYIYRIGSQLEELDFVTTPNYLYFFLLHVFTFDSKSFYFIAKLINIAILLFCIRLVALFAEKFVLSRRVLLMEILIISCSTNLYTSYLMPDSIYISLTVLLFIYIVGIDTLNRQKILKIALAIGLLSLIKPHALFMLLMFPIYITLSYRTSWLYSIFRSLIMSVLALFVKLSISFILVGSSGLSIFGELYTYQVQTLNSIERLDFVLINTLLVSLLHFSMFICFLGGPALLLFQALREMNHTNQVERLKIRLIVGLFSFSSVMLLLSSYFSSLIVGFGGEQTPWRLHSRYYEFLFIIFFFVSVIVLNESRLKINTARFWFGVVVIPLSLIYILITPYFENRGNYVDSATYSGFQTSKWLYFLFAFVNVFLLMHVSLKSNKSNSAFNLVFLVLFSFVTTSSVLSNREIWKDHYNSNIFDRAGIFTRSFLPEGEMSELLVTSYWDGPLRSTFMQLDSFEAFKNQRILPQGAIIDLSETQNNSRWNLIVGDYLIVNATEVISPEKGITLAR